MDKGADYRIIKLEKGPLQRFKNQNLLLKKYGEIGLQVYKAITGKRTAAELRADLGVEAGLFDEILEFMHDAGMVELQAVGARAPEHGVAVPEEEPPPEEKQGRALEEIPPEEAAPEEEAPPLEELPARKRKAAPPEEELRPAEEFSLEGIGEEFARQEKKPARKKEPEGIEPIEFGEEKPAKKKAVPPPEEEQPAEEEAPPPEEEIQPEEEIAPVSEEKEPSPEEAASEGAGAGLSPVEKIISNKYGDIGLRVYTLIDGQRTAEEIMRDTGLTESKLVEILNFMDEQGIIKLDYPKGQPPPPAGAAPSAAEARDATFAPMLEGEKAEEAGPVPSPVEIPVRAPMDIVKSVQMKANVMLKFGDRGSRVLAQVDGKNDTLDLALNLGIPLYTVTDVLKYLMEGGLIMMKQIPRAEVRKKYGDDGYAVYKRYGKEGLMLYELIGKELTIKQMADQITKDKSKVIDMFVFIHKVLGIELPLDRDLLAKQLGI
jgi:hypothetical protein